MWFSAFGVWISCEAPVSVQTCLHICVCSNAAPPGSAAYLCASVPEGSLLWGLQPELPLPEEHRALLCAHCCWVDTAFCVCKSCPQARSARVGEHRGRNKEGWWMLMAALKGQFKHRCKSLLKTYLICISLWLDIRPAL